MSKLPMVHTSGAGGKTACGLSIEIAKVVATINAFPKHRRCKACVCALADKALNRYYNAGKRPQ